MNKIILDLNFKVAEYGNGSILLPAMLRKESTVKVKLIEIGHYIAWKMHVGHNRCKNSLEYWH